MASLIPNYYDGGFRAVIDGAPVRLSFKPSATALEAMRGKNGTKLLREGESTRHPETTYSPRAVWLERRCEKCGEHSDHGNHEAGGAHKFTGAWQYLRSVSGIRDPRTFATREEAERG